MEEDMFNASQEAYTFLVSQNNIDKTTNQTVKFLFFIFYL